MNRCRAVQISDTDAEITSDIVQRVSDEITSLLRWHPINMKRKTQSRPVANRILLRGCSRSPILPNFNFFHNLLWNPSMMARTCIISGIGKELGFDIKPFIDDENFVENESTIFLDLNSCISNLHTQHTCKFAFFHIKAVDEASHDGNINHKIDLIESIDRIRGGIIEKLINEFPFDEFRIVITGDHSTLCRIGEHSCEPVPFLISKPLIKPKPYDSLRRSDYLKLSTCFINNNIGRFTGESVIAFLKHIVNSDEK